MRLASPLIHLSASSQRRADRQAPRGAGAGC